MLNEACCFCFEERNVLWLSLVVFMVYTSVEMVDLECVNNPVPVVRLDQLRSNMAVPVR